MQTPKIVPFSDEHLDAAAADAWFRLSFGASSALAMRETEPQEPIDAGVQIRRSTPDDLESSARLDRSMSESMQPSPSFSSGELWTEEQYIDDWRDTWTDDQFVHFVAECDGQIVGHILLYHRPPDLRVPKGSIDLAGASTF